MGIVPLIATTSMLVGPLDGEIAVGQGSTLEVFLEWGNGWGAEGEGGGCIQFSRASQSGMEY